MASIGRSRLVTAGAFCGITSAVLAIVALVGFIVAVGSQTISEGAQSPAFFVPATAALLSTVALAIALVALYVHQEAGLSKLGVMGFVIALVGTLMAGGAQWTYVFVVPHFADAVPEMINESTGTVLAGFFLSYALFSLGWILFGVATLRAGVFPRRGAIAVIVGAVIAFLPMPSRTLILALAVAYLSTQMRRPV